MTIEAIDRMWESIIPASHSTMPGNLTIQGFLLFVVLALIGGRLFLDLIHWVQSAPVRPDPWGLEISQALEDPECSPVCHRCLTPQKELACFCPKCGAAVGPYNNYMPWEQVFSEGEVLRNGTSHHLRRSPMTVVGFLLFSLVTYTIFAPFYWYRFFRNYQQPEPGESADPPTMAPGPAA